MREKFTIKANIFFWIGFFSLCWLAIFFILKTEEINAAVKKPSKEVILASFENGIPCSEEDDIIGFRKKDKMRAMIVKGGAEQTGTSALFALLPADRGSESQTDIFFQGSVRRMYLSTKNTIYDKNGPNALSFWIKLIPDSYLINKGERKNTFGVWTYHWEFGDENVGGKSNQGLATDSMMHGYSNFSFNEKAAGRWVNVVLTPSAFQQSRYYYHFYAARGTTDELQFFPSLRQLQFYIFPEINKKEEMQMDQLKLIYLQPTAVFEKEFFKNKISKNAGDIIVPLTISNPTNTDRRYRVFISSFIGVHRNVLYGAHSLTDSFEPPRMMQDVAEGNGGTGAVELTDKNGTSIIAQQREITISSKGRWDGKLIYHIKPEMLGPTKIVSSKGYKFIARRDTLTTSVIVWDPYDKTADKTEYIDVLPSNVDDGDHEPPAGFPPQKRPPEGWRSEDIPLNQVGGYFVSVFQLTD